MFVCLTMGAYTELTSFIYCQRNIGLLDNCQLHSISSNVLVFYHYFALLFSSCFYFFCHSFQLYFISFVYTLSLPLPPILLIPFACECDCTPNKSIELQIDIFPIKFYLISSFTLIVFKFGTLGTLEKCIFLIRTLVECIKLVDWTIMVYVYTFYQPSCSLLWKS